jgi:predicted DsbA family dithiol-disulfide isomerase
MRVDEYFPPQRVAEMRDYMKSFAARFGVTGFRQPERIPNTRRALALAEVARDEGRLDAFRSGAMEAHWRDGMNLESDDDLQAIASGAGLSSGAVERSISDPQYLDRIDPTRDEAGQIGVQGIPTFVIGNLGLSGCQPIEVLEDFATQAGAEKRP